ncbi:MAG: type II toxin-antitoxin system VapC family toxin [Candidatus Natronoplasma sp.]
MYIDSNIFIYSAVDKNQLGENCRNIVEKIENGSLNAASSYLMLDEVLWILQKNIGKEDALESTKMFLSLPIKWIDVKRDIMYQSLELYDSTDLTPRDAIHMASMKKEKLTVLLSEDDDFDDIEGIERRSANEFLEEV